MLESLWHQQECNGKRSKYNIIVQLSYFAAEFETEWSTFRNISTCLDQALMVACGLTQITTNA